MAVLDSWVPGFVGRRLDPEGALLAGAVAQAVGGLSWPEVATLMDDGESTAVFEVGGCIRTITVEAGWDMDPWQSDTRNAVCVSGVARGQSRGWSHRATAIHEGETLPDAPPAAVAFDFEALVRRAVVQHA